MNLIHAVAATLLVTGIAGCAATPDDLPTSPSPGDVEIARSPKLAARARVPEREPGFLGVDVTPGKLVITHDADLPPFAPGDVLAGTQADGYLVRVVSVHPLDGSRVSLDTVPADLTELLAEGHFRIHYDARVERRRDHATEEDGEPIGSAASALRIAEDTSLVLLDVASTELPARCGAAVKGDLRVDTKVLLTPDLDVEIEIGPKSAVNPLPELKRLRFVSGGSLDVVAKVHGSGTIDGRCEVDLLELAGGAASVSLPPLTFWAGPVPIVITSRVVPKVRANVEIAFTAAQLEAEAHTFAELQAGVDYQDGSWSTIWDPTGDAGGSMTVTAPGPVTARGAFHAGAELQARLYGIAGPNLGVDAYARVTAESAPPYCRYDAAVDGGVRAYASADVGVSAGPLNLTLGHLGLVDLEVVHFDGPRRSGELRSGPACATED